MAVCYQHHKTGQIRTRESWLAEPAMNAQGIQFMLNSGILKIVTCPTVPDENGEPGPIPEEGVFRPLGLDVGLKEILLFIAVIKVAKMPGGLQLIRELGKSFLKMIGDTLDSLGKASAANPVTAWANPYLVSIVLERFGFVDPIRMAEFRIGLSLISGAQVAEGFVDTLSSIVPFSPHDPSDFPATVNLGDKTHIEGIVSGLGEAAVLKAIEEE